MAQIDLGKVSITLGGEWSVNTIYEKLTIVTRNGESYVSRVDTQGQDPLIVTEVWQKVSRAGESLYQLMVDEGRFVGTLEEFLQEYEDTLQAAHDAAESTAQTNREVVQAEQVRASNENNRVSAEQERVQGESTRISNENERLSAERTRSTNESERIASENTRNENEQTRETNESERVNKERTRVSSESSRIANETTRQSAEQQRNTAESNRANNEGLRVSAEQTRVQNEQGRVSAEQTRAQNEQMRISAEQARETAETQRQSDFESAQEQRASDFTTSQNNRQSAYQESENSRDTSYQTAETTRNDNYSDAEAARQTAFGTAESTRQTAYETAEGTSESPAGDGSRWGAFKTAEAARDALVDEKVADITTLQSDVSELKDAVASAGVYDVSANNPTAGPNSDGKFASLGALLSDANLSTLIPTANRKGGMTIRFVQASDNKYVQYRLMTTAFSTNKNNWQGVDDEPSTGSKNLVNSGGIEKFVNNSVKDVNKKVFGVLKDSVELYTNISYTILSFTIEGGRQYTIKANLSAVLSLSVLIDIKQNDNLIYRRPIVGGALTLTYTWTPSSSLSGEVDIVISTADTNAKGKILSIVVENVEDSLDVELEQINARFNSLSNTFAPIQHTHTVSQITDIEENYAKYIEISSNKNLLKPTTKTGVINADGTISANVNYYISDFILVSPNTLYTLSHEIRAYVEFDINKNVIQSTYKTFTRLVRTDSKCRYIKISYSKSATEVQFEQNYKVTEYVPYVGKKVINSNSLSPDIDIANTIFSKDYAGGKNLLNRNYEVSGILDSTGTITANTNTVTSDFIPVLYNTNITISGTAASNGFVTFYCFYDINKSIVSYANVSSSSNLTLSVPKNAVMFRCSYRKASKDIMIEVGDVASEYEEFIPVRKISNDFLPELKMPEGIEFLRNLWYGKKLTVDGDSITHDQGRRDYWQYILKNNLTMSLLQSESFQCGDGTTEHVGNRGIGGSRIAYGEEQNDIKYCIGSRYQYLSDNADLVIIAGGTNDWAHNGVALGTMEDRTNVTFYGALHLLCNGLIVKYPSKQIVFMTPIKRGVLGSVNQRGNTLEEFANAIIEVCGYYGIPVIDLFHQLCMNPSIQQQRTLYFLTGDDTHPNTAGHLRMGNFVTGKVKEIQTIVDWE